MLTLSAVNLPLKGLKVTARQKLAGQDMSGNSASTDQAETGDKAKILVISGTLPFTNDKVLDQIYTMAGAKVDGARKVYRVANQTAKALRINQVKFQGTITAQEDTNLRQWVISFELVEHLSVAERVESRQPAKSASQQKAAGVETPAEPPTASVDTPPNTEVDMSGVMGYLQSLDRALA